ncbi:MAG: hypothetical protein B6242_10365 [Anaerolineaceae bacterium 4572_78]|nr:MAG: hypothetical protein B6242_10365 [Anaerolineaceae bacterium 4572_78]
MPTNIQKLIEHFKYNQDEYMRANYNETQTRRKFIDPFFMALGWDVSNEAGYALAYQQVVHEDAIKVGGATKAPDYSFRIGGVRKFFVEAKKPSVKLFHDVNSAFQLRRYGWSAKLSLSILTNFAELTIYDCRMKPNRIGDKASHARILYMTLDEYAHRWHEIADVFSPQAIMKGAFDKFSKSKKSKRGTAEVDDALLQEIETWRNLLAKNIALRNPDISHEQLNFGVQCVIDRIIFLRICEDRGIETYGRLMALQNGKNVYERFMHLCHQADIRYNSGLFHFRHEKGRPDISMDTITTNLTIDDKTLKDIFNGLYYPESPYEFSMIPADILGQVYEQFLGKVIRLTEGHRAKVEEKPEVKKAGGVYYTPTYIVDYIVAETVGKLLHCKSPKAIGHVKILDPACGSGTFLLQAYQFLLDWYLEYYSTHEPEKWAKKKKPPIRESGIRIQDSDLSGFRKPDRSKLAWQELGSWQLTLHERKRILIAHIHGVDIDRQAVEVTKLSLFLKVLEGENDASLQPTLIYERALPDLSDNIKCGNSLVGWDVLQESEVGSQESDMKNLNPFDWHAEFSTVMAAGGFDAIIGNPPYARIQTLVKFYPMQVDYFKKTYQSAKTGNYDIYVLFLEKCMQLMKKSGMLGFILPHKFFNAKFGRGVRKVISDKQAISHVVYFGAEQIFRNATTYTCLLCLHGTPQEKFVFVKINENDSMPETLNFIQNQIEHVSYEPAMIMQPQDDSAWHFYGAKTKLVLDKLYQQPQTLADATHKIFQGIATSADKIYVLRILKEGEETYLCYSKHMDKEIEIEKGLVKPFLMGKNVHRYEPVKPINVVIFPYQLEPNKATLMAQTFIQEHYPMGWKYLHANRKALEGRERGRMKGERFYAYIYPKNLLEFERVKIMTRDICDKPSMSIDVQGNLYHTTTLHSFVFKETCYENHKYFLGVCNSKILHFFLQATGTVLRGGYIRFLPLYLSPFPIRRIDFDNAAEIAMHEHMVSLVESMLDLNARLAVVKSPHEEVMLQRQIVATDRQIDMLVYSLYDLTESEIKIVEKNCNNQ